MTDLGDGSRRAFVLRRRLGKGFSDADVARCAEMSRQHGMRFVKLYFMVGLPGETEADLAAVGRLVKRVARELPTKVALTPFVPKPRTPLANAPTPARAELQRRLRALTRELRRIGNVRVTAGGVAEAQVETLLSHAGREAADLLERGREALRAEATRFGTRR